MLAGEYGGKGLIVGDKLLNVKIVTPEKILFQGRADHVMLPGEGGVFEVLPFHKALLSRLLAGTIVVDDKLFPVMRGVVQVSLNQVTVIMENHKMSNEEEKVEKK